MLTSPRADRVRSVRALSRRSARERAGRFLVEGPQSVREAVRWCPESVLDLYVTTGASTRHTELVGSAHDAGVPVHECSDEVLAAMCDTQTPQGLLAVCRVLPARLPAHLDDVLAADPRLVCVLTHVRDPGNAGTVLRAADAAGADAVLISDSSVDVFSPKVIRSTAGSLFHLPVVVGWPAEQLLDRLGAAGLTRLAADGAGAVELPEVDLRRRHAWVFGNEAWGLPASLRERCDQVVRVPIHGRAESLNLAMAATVCLYASAGAQRA